MLIIVDEPNQDLGGGALCAPIAAQVTQEAMNVLGIEPKYNDSEMKDLSKQTPNVVGKSLDEAKKRLKKTILTSLLSAMIQQLQGSARRVQIRFLTAVRFIFIPMIPKNKR